MEQKNNAPFLAFTRICLNNWHYISRKILSLNKEINFFTGHSGSGKSTVIDALQLVLYANTDGRGFFNKAAADDSDRSLIEYLRGMVNIGEIMNFPICATRISVLPLYWKCSRPAQKNISVSVLSLM